MRTLSHAVVRAVLSALAIACLVLGGVPTAAIAQGSDGIALQAKNAAAATLNATDTTVIQVKLRPTTDVNAITASASNTDKINRAFNTVTLGNAIAQAKATSVMAGTANRARNKVELRVGAGTFAFDPDTNYVIDFAGFSLRGQSDSATTLIVQTHSAFFDFGTFTTTPSTLYVDVGFGYTFRDIAIYNPLMLGLSNHGTRYGAAIRDNGAGSGRIQNVRIGGFGVGYQQTWASDFSVTDHLYVELNDIGKYVGPASQQTKDYDLNAYHNQYNEVLDRPVNHTCYGCVFNSAAESNILIEAPSDTTTRFLTALPGGWSLASQISFVDDWFEGNAGGSGDLEIPRDHITFNTGTSDAYRGISIIRPYIISYGVAGNPTPVPGVTYTSSFINGGSTTRPQYLTLDHPVNYGYLDVWVANHGNRLTIIDDLTGNGTGTPIALSNGSGSVTLVRNTNNAGSSPPTSGYWPIGFFYRNTGPAVVSGKVLLGWERMTNGVSSQANANPTDWQPIYATTS